MNRHQAPGGTAWEAAALAVLEQLARPPAPIDSLMLALHLGVRLESTSVSTAMLVGNAVLVSPKLSPLKTRWLAAHELGHWILRQRRMENGEPGADRVAETLLLPPYAFEPDSCGWHVGQLQRVHRYCSLETIARRIFTLRSACMSIWRTGEPVIRKCAPGTPPELARVTGFERTLALAARQLGGVVYAGPRLIAFVDDDDPSRVITLCSSDVLRKRAFLRRR